MRNIISKINLLHLRKFILLSVFLLSLILVFTSIWIADSYSSCSALPAISEQISKVKIRDDGTTLVNGKSFFPFGFYHVSWQSTAKERINALQEIAAAGFNTIHASAKKLEDYGEFLDEAERLGVYVLTEQSVGLSNLVNAFKHKSAVLGWNIADDVDEGELTRDQVLKLHQNAKSSDPDHITYISGYSRKIGQFANCSDVLAIQSYPIRVGTEKELSSTYAKVSIAHNAATKFKQALYANLQTFSWSFENTPENRNARSPKFEEVRNMTYQALLAGAKGIIYYTYYDDDWYLPEHPDLWAGMKSLVPEMQAISSFLLDGDLKIIDTGRNNLLAGIWVYQNQTLAVIINTSYDRINEVAIKLPANAREAKLIFPDRASGMSVKNGQLTGSLNPLAVDVYILRN